MNGETGDGASEEAVAFREKQCDDGNMEICLGLGRTYFLGEGVPQDRARAAALYQEACDNGNPHGCNNYAWLRCHDEQYCEAEIEAAAHKSVELAPSAANIDTLGYVLCQRGQHEEAEAAYARACELAPEHSEDPCGQTCAP